MLLETAILANTYSMPNAMTEEEFVYYCEHTRLSDYQHQDDKIHILANLLVKLILLRRQHKYYYTDFFLIFIGQEHVGSVILARICLRGGDEKLYTMLDRIGLFAISPDLPILACATNDYNLVYKLVKSSIDYFNTVVINDSQDLICCENSSPEVFSLIEMYLSEEDILHIWNMTDRLDLTKYIWKTYNHEAFGGFITVSQLVEKSVWSATNPDIIKFIDSIVSKKHTCSVQ